jgi:muconate cycloisomerase
MLDQRFSNAMLDTSRDFPPLAIRRVDVFSIALPLLTPILMASVKVTQSENLLVRLEAADGQVGWGEASAAPMMTGDTLAGMTFAAGMLTPLLTGQDAVRRAVLVERCMQVLRDNYSAVAAVDMALLDLTGRHFGMPVCDLLGGVLRDRMQALFLLGNKTVEEDIAEALAKQREGARFFKIKVGVNPIAEDISRVLELRQALGPEVKLCADANMGFKFENARRFVTDVVNANLLFLEQPFGKHDLKQASELARLSPVALGADEGIASVGDLVEHQRAGAAVGAALKTIKLRGVVATARAAIVCQALGLAVNLSSKMGETSIGSAGLLHIGASLADTAWGMCPTCHHLAVDIVKNPVRAEAGMFALPPGPGLGVEIDEAAVERYRV